MKASIVDLRYKTKEILKALDRNESVTVLYHGKVKGVISPAGQQASQGKVSEHPFFSMYGRETGVEQQMDELRKPRYDF